MRGIAGSNAVSCLLFVFSQPSGACSQQWTGPIGFNAGVKMKFVFRLIPILLRQPACVVRFDVGFVRCRETTNSEAKCAAFLLSGEAVTGCVDCLPSLLLSRLFGFP